MPESSARLVRRELALERDRPEPRRPRSDAGEETEAKPKRNPISSASRPRMSGRRGAWPGASSWGFITARTTADEPVPWTHSRRASRGHPGRGDQLRAELEPYGRIEALDAEGPYVGCTYGYSRRHGPAIGEVAVKRCPAQATSVVYNDNYGWFLCERHAARVPR